MAFHKPRAEVVVFSPIAPDEALGASTDLCINTHPDEALNASTDLCIAAHPDDIEIMAYGAIAACYKNPKRNFCGVVVSDGAGSPRSGMYQDYTDEEMIDVRKEEQKTAAQIGNYHAQVFLSFTSSEIKDPENEAVVDDLYEILLACRADTVYTHNLADKHDTHVAVTLRTIEALRRLPEALRPQRVYAMEVWRGLDWLCDNDKSVFDTSNYPDVAAAVLGAFDSQIAGGKRYDAASLGRRLANATFYESRRTDASSSLSFGLDITALAYDASLSPSDFIRSYISNFENEVTERIARL